MSVAANQGNVNLNLSAQHLLRPVIGFVFAFLLPILLLSWWVIKSDTDSGDSNPESDKSFPNSLVIRNTQDNLVLRNSADIQPIAGKDFNLVIWFRLQRLPANNAKEFLVLKYDSDATNRQGYSLALTRDGDKVRPLVFWGSSEVASKWFNFESFTYSNKTWQALVLSFIDGQYLGLHLLRLEEGTEGEVVLLGGYRFEQPVLAVSDADLTVGGMSTGHLPRARIGAFAITQIEKLTEKLPDMLKALAASDAPRALIEQKIIQPSFFIDDFRNMDPTLAAGIVKFPPQKKNFRNDEG